MFHAIIASMSTARFLLACALLASPLSAAAPAAESLAAAAGAAESGRAITSATAALRRKPRLPAKFLAIPYHRQETDYSCGAAAVLAVLRYWRAYDGSEGSLYERLQTTPKDGTHPKKMTEGLRSFGLKAELSQHLELEDLRAALKRGETAILDIQAWRTEASPRPWSKDWDDGHYVVLIAMDEQSAYVMDPSVDGGAYGWLPLAELLERWHDYEDRYGPREETFHLAILASGDKTPSVGPRRRLVKVE
jgi:predicted double-glycine peptidase